MILWKTTVGGMMAGLMMNANAMTVNLSWTVIKMVLRITDVDRMIANTKQTEFELDDYRPLLNCNHDATVENECKKDDYDNKVKKDDKLITNLIWAVFMMMLLERNVDRMIANLK